MGTAQRRPISLGIIIVVFLTNLGQNEANLSI